MHPIYTLQQHLSENEGLLITSFANRRYVTGFPSSAGLVLVTKEQSYFLTDFRYFEKAVRVVTSCQVIMLTSLTGDVLPLLQKHNIKLLFAETDTVSLETFHRWEQAFAGIALSKDSKMTHLLSALRSVKSPEEIASIKAAQALTDATFDYILPRIQAGRSEIDVMLDMEFFMRRQGSEGVAFDFVVVSGSNSSLPHGVPTQRQIQTGDFVTMDFGAVINGYRSDMTRTVAVGNITQEQKQVYHTVWQAKTAAMTAIKPGVMCKAVDKVARDLIDHASYAGCFGHGLGHGVGLEIHEDPSFNTRCETLLAAGMVITVEPGIYLEGKYGVRIEDMIVVTETGYQNLTHSPDELILL